MADANAEIKVNIDTSSALSSLKLLQAQISAFHSQMAKTGGAAAQAAANIQQNLLNNINATGQFSAQLKTIKSSTEAFTTALEKNKLSMGQYFKYAGGASKSFGKFFKTEFDTINKVATERVKDLQTQYIKMGRDANGALKAIAVRPLALDMENLTTKTMMAAQKQQLLNQLLKQGSTQMLNWGKNTQWAGRQLMVGFTIPLSIAGTAAAKTFMEMEEQVLKFKRVYGDLNTTVEETNKMSDNIRTLGRTFTQYGVSVKDTMALAAQAAASGKMGADLIAQVTEATRLSVLGQIDQQQALESTMSVTNAFGIAAEDLAKKINFLNAVENQTVTSIDDLTIAIPKAAPVIKQLGGDVEDLTFFLTAMREGGINASEGANALKSGLAAMINPTGKAAEMLQGFGINLKGIVEANKGNVKGLVIDFANALNQLDPLNRARAIEQLFGKFQFARLSTLFKNVVANGTQASRVLDLASSSSIQLANLASQELSKVSESPMFKFKKAIEDIKTTLIPIGEEFLKAVTPVIEFGTGILKSFNKMDGGVKQFIVTVTGVVAGLGPVLLMTFGLLANGVANIIKGFSAVKNVFNRATSSSKVLGESVSYLTQDQIEAYAAASSLEQAHSKLTQAFTVEKTAVDNLRTSYERAAAAQAAFMGNNVVTRGSRKFAGGGLVTGPGTGTSDSIPAMVSNGEAIIPAKTVKKYPKVVGMLLGGKVPGFADGTIVNSNREAGRGRMGRLGKSLFAILRSGGQNFAAGSTGTTGFTDISDPTDIMTAYAPQILKESGGSRTAINREITSWQEKNKQLLEQATVAVKRGVSAQEAYADINEKFLKDIKAAQGPTSKFFDAAEKLYPQMEADLKEAQAIVKKENIDLQTGEGTARLSQLAPNNRAAQMLSNTSGYQSSAKTRSAIISRAGASSFGKYGVPTFFLPRNLGPENQYLSSIRATADHVNKTLLQEGKKFVTQAIENTKNGIVSAAKKATKTASPSKETQKVGEDIGQGAINGMKNKVDDAAVAGEQLGDATVRGARVAGRRAMSAAGIPGGTQSSPSRARVSRRAQSQPGYYEGGVFIPTNIRGDVLTSGVSDVPYGPNLPAKGTPEYKAYQASLKAARKAKRPTMGKMQKVMASGAIGMAASTAVSAASMAPGQIGQVASQILPLVSTLSMVTPVLASFGITLSAAVIGPLLGVAAGIAGLVLVVNAINDAKKKELERTNALNNAMSTTGPQLKKLGEITGVGYKESRMSKSSVIATGATAKQQSDAEILLKNKEFKKTFSKNISAMKNLSGTDQNLALANLATSLFGQGYDEKTAQAVIDAIQLAAGKKSLEFKVADINFSTKEGKAGFEKFGKDVVKQANDAIAKANVRRVASGSAKGGTYLAGDREARAAAMRSAASYLSTGIIAATTAMDSGTISAKEYYKQIAKIKTDFDSLKNTAKAGVLSKMFSDPSIDEGIKKLSEGMTDVTQKFQLYQLTVAGVDIPTNIANMIEQISSGKGKQIAKAKLAVANWLKTTTKSLEDIIKDDNITDTINDTVNDTKNGTDKITKALEKQKAALEAKLKSLRAINDELKKQEDFELRQMQRNVDIRRAVASGDYLQAAVLRQQGIADTAEYNQQQEEARLETAIARIDKRIAKRKKGKAMGGLLVGPGTGTSDSINGILKYAGGGQIPINLSNGEYVTRASSVAKYGVGLMNAINSGTYNPTSYSSDAVYNINMTINGGNANANDIANMVINKLEVIKAKNNTSNKVVF